MVLFGACCESIGLKRRTSYEVDGAAESLFFLQASGSLPIFLQLLP